MNNIDLLEIGDKKKLPNPNDVAFASLDSYLTIAKKVVCKHADKIRPGLSAEILRNEDALANIAHAIMMADWQFNGKGTLNGWRSQKGRWALMGYIRRAKKRNSNSAMSLDLNISDTTAFRHEDTRTFHDSVSSKCQTPLEEVSEKNRQEVFRVLLVEMMDEACLSTRQRQMIQLHYLEGVPVSEIVETDKSSRQNVHLLLQKGLAALAEVVENNPRYKRIFENEVLS